MPESRSFDELDGRRAPGLIRKVEFRRQLPCVKIGEMEDGIDRFRHWSFGEERHVQ
jgi:hypothetical protein